MSRTQLAAAKSFPEKRFINLFEKKTSGTSIIVLIRSIVPIKLVETFNPLSSIGAKVLLRLIMDIYSTVMNAKSKNIGCFKKDICSVTVTFSLALLAAFTPVQKKQETDITAESRNTKNIHFGSAISSSIAATWEDTAKPIVPQIRTKP